MKAKISFSELVDCIAEQSQKPKQQVRTLLKELVAVIQEGLLRDGRVVMAGLGIFKVSLQEARTGINPQTGEALEIPAHQRIIFKPNAGLRNFINRKYSHLKPKVLGAPAPPAPEKEALQADTIADEEHFSGIEALATPPPKKHRKGFRAMLLGILLLLFLGYATGVLNIFNIPTAPAKKAVQLQEVVAVKFWSPEETVRKTIPEIPLPTESLALEEPPPPAPEPPEPEPPPPVPEPPEPGTPAGVRTVGKGDSFWSISKAFYEDPFLWPNIFRANHQTIQDPDTLDVGATVDIPALEGRSGALTHQDKSDIAVGYILVYLNHKKRQRPDARDYLWVARQLSGPETLHAFQDDLDPADNRYATQIEGDLHIQ